MLCYKSDLSSEEFLALQQQSHSSPHIVLINVCVRRAEPLCFHFHMIAERKGASGNSHATNFSFLRESQATRDLQELLVWKDQKDPRSVSSKILTPRVISCFYLKQIKHSRGNGGGIWSHRESSVFKWNIDVWQLRLFTADWLKSLSQKWSVSIDEHPPSRYRKEFHLLILSVLFSSRKPADPSWNRLFSWSGIRHCQSSTDAGCSESSEENMITVELSMTNF